MPCNITVHDEARGKSVAGIVIIPFHCLEREKKIEKCYSNVISIIVSRTVSLFFYLDP